MYFIHTLSALYINPFMTANVPRLQQSLGGAVTLGISCVMTEASWGARQFYILLSVEDWNPVQMYEAVSEVSAPLNPMSARSHRLWLYGVMTG